MPRYARLRAWIPLAVFAVAGLGAIAVLVVRAQRLPSGPIEIVWDKDVCTHCHMHIGNPSFAAQLQARDARILNFDDPGCLLRYQKETNTAAHAVYFHELNGSQWLRDTQVAFVRISPTPMGYGFGAVELGTPAAISLQAASDEIENKRGPGGER